MKTKLHYLLVTLALLAGSHQATAQGTTAFTYQGQLKDGGTNANGTYTMIFKLYDAVSAGNQVGSAITNSPTLGSGLFSVNLDFGNIFNGSARWLDITITNGGVTQTLSPRVQVLPTPYAQFAAVAATVTNGAILNAQLAGNAVNKTNIASGQVVKSLNGLSDVVSFLAGANLVLTTNGNALQISTESSAVTAIDGNLRIIRGIINGDGTILYGSGFTVSYAAAGSGGTTLGTVNGAGANNQIVVIGATVHGDQWLFIDGVFYQVQSQSGNVITLTSAYTGNLGANVIGNMRLFPAYTIVFSTSFSSPPAIAATANGNGGSSGLAGFSSDWFSVNVLRTDATSAQSQFQVAVTRPSETINFNGVNSPHGFDFIAVGPK